MRLILSISILLVGLAHSEPAKESPTVPRFKVERVGLQEAIRSLNKAIAKAHPGKNEYLVAYVESPHPEFRHDTKLLELAYKNNPPIVHIVEALTRRSLCHWRKAGSTVVVYGWHEGQSEEPNNDESEQSEDANAGNAPE